MVQVPPTTQSTFGTVTGIVSNLGQLSLTYELTINLMTGNSTGSGVLLIAKNGDSIFTTVSGKFHLPMSPLSVPSITETYTVTGGTGRFNGATGQFMVERLVDFVDTKMDFSFTGGVIINGTITFSNAENDNAKWRCLTSFLLAPNLVWRCLTTPNRWRLPGEWRRADVLAAHPARRRIPKNIS
jgi:hypothetical protein